MSWKKQKTQQNGIDVPEGLNVRYQEIPLYPEIDLKQPKVKSQQEIEIYNLQAEFIKNCKNSIFYIEPNLEKQEVERYSDKYTIKKKREPFKTLIKSIKTKELLSIITGTTKKRKQSIHLQDIDFSKLEELEKQELDVDTSKQTKDGEQDSDAENIEEDQDDDEEGDNDYQVDYYDDEHDAFGGDESDGGNLHFTLEREFS